MSKEAILEKIKVLDEKLADKELSEMHSFFENAKKKLENDLKSLGGEEPKEEKPKATKKTPSKKKPTKKKPTKKKPTKDEYESAMADLKKKSGMTEEKCLEIIEEYRALRKKSQERKAKENKAKVKKNAEQKKRTDKLKEQGKLNEEGTLTPEAVIEQDIPKVEEKAEQEIEKIKEDNTPKPTKEEPKPKPTKQGEKKIKEGVKEVAEDTTDAIQEMLMAILGVVKNQDPSVAKASLIKLRDALTKEINTMAYGGLTDGAVANMNVTQSQMSAESVNPQMYAEGGEVITDYEYFRGKDHDEFTNYIMDRISLDDRREIRKEWNEKERVSRAKGERGVEWQQYLLDSVNKNKMAKGGMADGKVLLASDKGIGGNKDKTYKFFKDEEGYYVIEYPSNSVVAKDRLFLDVNDMYRLFTGKDGITIKLDKGEFKKGGMTQGYNDRMDESLGMRHRGHHSQSHKDRRDEAKGMNKGMGNRAYQSVGSMDKMAKGGGVRSWSELAPIQEKINKQVDAMTPKEMADAWNSSHPLGMKNPMKWTAKEVSKNIPYNAMYLKGSMFENELNEKEYRKYFAKGGSTNANWIQDVVDSPNFDKGAFTRKAKNRGMTTMELMKDVLSNPNEYTLKTRRQAQFMKNAM